MAEVSQGDPTDPHPCPYTKSINQRETPMFYSDFVSAFRSAGEVSVRAWLGDRSFVYSFDDLFEFDDWCQWEGGDFDRLELAA